MTAPVQTPTQQAHPWRATLRTVLATLIHVAAATPSIVDAIGDVPGWLIPAEAAVVAVAGAITRTAAVPAVDRWLSKLGLYSTPAADLPGKHEATDTPTT